jgi:solute carrier family 27 fatty acid transporter 1/4
LLLNTVNSVGKLGACGFMPLVNRFFRLMPVSIIKIDNEMNPIRNEQSFCIQCKPGEAGLLIGFIGKLPTQQYSGYANNPKESSKKVIENVFRSGQRAFNSG